MTRIFFKSIQTTVCSPAAGRRKAMAALFVIMLPAIYGHAQNVGIGTNSPTRKLSVSGTVVVDHDSTSNGTLDNASLLFGSGAAAGISSNKNAATPNFRGMDFWTAGVKRFSISNTGNVGIGTDLPGFKLHVSGSLYTQNNVFVNQSAFISSTLQVDEHVAIAGSVNSNYRLSVNNGNSHFDGNGTFTGNLTVSEGIRSLTAIRADERMAVGGVTDNNYRFRVYDGNARIGGDFHATGNAAIGGEVDNNYRLRVYNGNSRFGGDVQVTGTLNSTDLSVANNFSINGTGSVRSNGPSPLRIGFDQKSVNMFIANNEDEDVTVNITGFTGDNDDVRVVVAQVVNDPAGSLDWAKVGVSVWAVNAANDTCILRFHNRNGFNGTLVGTIYLMTVAKDN